MEKINAFARRVPTGVVWVAGLVPLAWLVWAAANGGLGVEPVKAIELRLGLWGLQFLIASLCITPLRRLGLNLLRFRRALGVLSFIYIALHFTAWVTLDMGLRWSEIWADLYKRPYIILGMLGLLCLIPLAATSTNFAIRRLGGQNWRKLHRLAYLAVAAGGLHYVILVKGWQTQPLIYAGAIGLLLAWRGLPARRRTA